VPPSSVDTLAESLASTFPGCDDAPLAFAVLRELANGRPVAMSSLPDGALSRHADGTVLGLDDAYELGRRATRCCAG
jgi:hypothetical protein